MPGIEPGYLAWQANILPLNHIRIIYNSYYYYLYLKLSVERIFTSPDNLEISVYVHRRQRANNHLVLTQWSRVQASNLQPTAYETVALPD